MSQVVAPVVATPVYACRIAGSLAAAGSNVKASGNTLYYRLSTQVVAPTKTALNTVFAANVIVALLAACNVRWTPVSNNIRNIADASDAELPFVLAGAGAIATDSSPSDDAVVVCLLSGARGKQGKAYKHFGGLNEIDTTGDVLTGAGLARWQAVRDAVKLVLTDALGNIWTPFIRCNLQAEYVTPPIIVRGYDANGGYLATIPGTMAKRKAKGVKS